MITALQRTAAASLLNCAVTMRQAPNLCGVDYRRKVTDNRHRNSEVPCTVGSPDSDSPSKALVPVSEITRRSFADWHERALFRFANASCHTFDRHMEMASAPIQVKSRVGSRSGRVRSSGDGARGRSRTGTTVRLRDFRPTSTFAASASAVRGLEHAFTVAWGRRCPPSALYTFPRIL
jgi:hypothetical protein